MTSFREKVIQLPYETICRIIELGEQDGNWITFLEKVILRGGIIKRKAERRFPIWKLRVKLGES